jgi:hypothetical protein
MTLAGGVICKICRIERPIASMDYTKKFEGLTLIYLYTQQKALKLYLQLFPELPLDIE